MVAGTAGDLPATGPTERAAVTNGPSTTQVVHFDFISLAEGTTEEAIEDLIQEAAGLLALDSVQVVGVIRGGEAATTPLERGGYGGEEPEVDAEAGEISTPPLERGGYRGEGPEVSAEAGEIATGYGREGSARSDFDLAFFFVLEGFTALEPFGTHAAYIQFLQGKVARMLRGFAGADVSLRAPFPEIGAYATCLALAAPDETYDWEVWAALDDWAEGSPARAVGLAIGERQRYRGCVVTFTSTPITSISPADDRFQTSVIAGAAQQL